MMPGKTEETRQSPELRILFVEDSEDDYLLVLNTLKKEGRYQLKTNRVDNEKDLLEALRKKAPEGDWHAIISDFHMPSFSGLAALAATRSHGYDIPFILVSGAMGEETAVGAMRAGAQDYLMKSDLGRLLTAIEREIKEHANRRKLRENEEQLRQAQKMETVGMLAGGIAHDFNNILTIILMHCDYVLSDPEGINRALSSIEQIQRSAFRAAGLTRQLLAFCRKQVVKLEILSVNAVISNVKPMIESLIGDKIQVIFTLGGSLDKVRADLVQIEQLIMNLSINARDAMPEGGRLKIETRNVQVDGASWVELAISDSGIGMDVATQKRIFEPFFTTKGPDKGTGLGLATVYNIVQHCGGRIAVQSEVGKGSRFIIRLPKVGEESQTHSAPKGTAKSAPQRHLRILLMEDEPEVRKILKTIIEEKGFEVIAPATCDEAVAIYRQEHKDIHLVISDVNLPGMSGPALARLLSEIKPSMQVLFISGYFDDDPNMRQVVERGHFLQKPFSHDQLIEKILEVAAPR